MSRNFLPLRTWIPLVLPAFVLISLASCGRNSSQDSSSHTIHCHFLGWEKILAGTNAPVFADVFKMQETINLRTQTVAKVAGALLRHLDIDPTGRLESAAALLRAGFGAESVLQGNTLVDGQEWIWAVHLNQGQHTVFQSTIPRLLSGWQMQPEGTAVKFSKGARMLRLDRVGDWTLLHLSGSSTALWTAMRDQLGKAGRPAPQAGDWLHVQVDGKVLERMGGRVNEAEPERLEFRVWGEGENVRAKGTLSYAESLDIRLKPWRIPTNHLTTPFISFVASQEIEKWFPVIPALAHTYFDPLPGEFYIWALGKIQMQTFAAIPQENARQALERLGNSIIRDKNPGLLALDLKGWSWNSNRTEVALHGTPFATPHFTVIRDAGTEYLFAGLGPLPFGSNQVPAELLSRFVGRTNLLHYGWEITEARLKDWLYLSQLYLYLGKRPQLPKDSGSVKWIHAITPKLGNTITEVIQINPTDVEFVRRGHLGLTAFEIILLANWLESPAFPALR